METRIVIAGSGGQGIMFMGKLLAEAALAEGKNVTFLPSYGAEVRGGTADCTLVVSDEEIGSPYAETIDVLVVMNEPSLVRFGSKLSKGGRLIANSSLIGEKAVPAAAAAFPFTRIAIDLGSAKSANMVAAGCFAKKTGIVGADAVIGALNNGKVKAAVRELNEKAVRAGAAL
jgi:2-oxoglutarate ferredoxin oxidoreductase subunit gamma